MVAGHVDQRRLEHEQREGEADGEDDSAHEDERGLERRGDRPQPRMETSDEAARQRDRDERERQNDVHPRAVSGGGRDDLGGRVTGVLDRRAVEGDNQPDDERDAGERRQELRPGGPGGLDADGFGCCGGHC